MQQTTEISALLQWQMAMGVDETIGELPENWLLAPPPPPPKQAPQTHSASPKIVPIVPAATAPASGLSLAETIAQAEKAASGAATIEDLREAILAFDGCALKKTARHTVFADGNPESDIMVIGETPSADDDMRGEAFCGETGALLNKMLASIGLRRAENCYLTHSIFWRPAGNRPPSDEEIAICLPFLKRHIALFAPKLIVLLGSTGAKALLNESRSITRLHGEALLYHEIPVRAIFHPSYLLRQPLQKKLAWHDLIAIKALIEEKSLL